MPKKTVIKAVAAIKIAPAKGYKLELLPGEFNGSWKNAQAWATKQGGDLPTRAEGAALYADKKTRAALGDSGTMWLKEPHPKYAGYAWFQFFGNGNQFTCHQDYDLGARAVRRTPL